MYFLVLWSLMCRTSVTEAWHYQIWGAHSGSWSFHLGVKASLFPQHLNLETLRMLTLLGSRKSMWSPEAALPWTWTAACSTETQLIFHFRALRSPPANAQPPVLWALEPSFLPSNLLTATRDHLKAHVMSLPSTFPPSSLTTLPDLVSACLSRFISHSFSRTWSSSPFLKSTEPFCLLHLYICSSPCLYYFPPLSLSRESLSPMRVTLNVTSSRILSQVHQRWYFFGVPLVLYLYFPFLTVGFSGVGTSPYPFSVEPLAWHQAPRGHSVTTGTQQQTHLLPWLVFLAGYLYICYSQMLKNQDVQKQNSFPSPRLRILESPSLIIPTVSCCPVTPRSPTLNF